MQTLILFRVLSTINIFPRNISLNVEILSIYLSNEKAFLELFLLGSFVKKINAPGPRLYSPSRPLFFANNGAFYDISTFTCAISDAPRPCSERCALSQSATRMRRPCARWLVYSKEARTQSRHLNVLKSRAFLVFVSRECWETTETSRHFALLKVSRQNEF